MPAWRLAFAVKADKRKRQHGRCISCNEQLRWQKVVLTQELCTLERDGGDERTWEHFLRSLLDVQDQASRLDRMLDAMRECGFPDGAGADWAASYVVGRRAEAFA